MPGGITLDAAAAFIKDADARKGTLDLVHDMMTSHPALTFRKVAIILRTLVAKNGGEMNDLIYALGQGMHEYGTKNPDCFASIGDEAKVEPEILRVALRYFSLQYGRDVDDKLSEFEELKSDVKIVRTDKALYHGGPGGHSRRMRAYEFFPAEVERTYETLVSLARGACAPSHLRSMVEKGELTNLTTKVVIDAANYVISESSDKSGGMLLKNLMLMVGPVLPWIYKRGDDEGPDPMSRWLLETLHLYILTSEDMVETVARRWKPAEEVVISPMVTA